LTPSVQMSPSVDANATRRLPKEMREKREGIGNIGGRKGISPFFDKGIKSIHQKNSSSILEVKAN